MANEKSLLFFFALTHTIYLSQRRQHFALSFLFSSPRTALSWLSSFSLSGSLLAALSSFSFLHGFLFLCSCTYSFCVFLKVVVPYSPFPPVFLPSENLFSHLVSCSIFPLPMGRTLRPKPSNSL